MWHLCRSASKDKPPKLPPRDNSIYGPNHIPKVRIYCENIRWKYRTKIYGPNHIPKVKSHLSNWLKICTMLTTPSTGPIIHQRKEKKNSMRLKYYAVKIDVSKGGREGGKGQQVDNCHCLTKTGSDGERLGRDPVVNVVSPPQKQLNVKQSRLQLWTLGAVSLLRWMIPSLDFLSWTNINFLGKSGAGDFFGFLKINLLSFSREFSLLN